MSATARIGFNKTSGSRECPAVGVQHATAQGLVAIVRTSAADTKHSWHLPHPATLALPAASHSRDSIRPTMSIMDHSRSVTPTSMAGVQRIVW